MADHMVGHFFLKGTRLTKQCMDCGARNSNDARFCALCMTAFGLPTLPNPPQRLMAPVPPPVQPAIVNDLLPPPPPPAQTGVVMAPTPAIVHAGVGVSQGGSSGMGHTPPSTIPIPTTIGETIHAEHTSRLTEGELREAQVNENGLGILHGEPVWVCPSCALKQPMTSFVCQRCQHRFGHSPQESIPVADTSRYERYFPGLGFIKAGKTAHGLPRMLIVVSWILACILVGLQRPLMALPLLVGIIILWVSGKHDLVEVINNRPPFFNTKRLLFLIIGVILTFILIGTGDFYLGTMA